MKKFFALITLALIICLFPSPSFAAGTISASGGGSKTEGQTFTVNVTASGASFNAIQGTISVSGPVSIVSFTAGGATWMRAPANGAQFVGMTTSPVSSLTVATIKLKGTKPGSGSVSVSGTKLALSGSVVGTGAGSASFTITRAPQLPGAITVTSTTHPDPNIPYEATTITLNWNKPAGVTGFAYLLDQVADTNPPNTVTSADTAISYANQAIGTYYFHIKGKNNDGWGSPTHFKITIKEPDPKVDPTLAKPSNIKISKGKGFTNNVKDGTVTNLMISGQTKTGFQANIKLTPAPTIPEGKTLSAETDSTGKFKLFIDFPIASGFHTLVIQGQKEKVLTPETDPIRFEITQHKGGAVYVLSDKDTKTPAPAPAKKTIWQQWTALGRTINYAVYAGILIITAAVVVIILKKKGVFKIPEFPL